MSRIIHIRTVPQETQGFQILFTAEAEVTPASQAEPKDQK